MKHRDQIRGFTLLEVLIALAILASSLTILIGTMAHSGQQSIYANKLTQVTQAARSKMTDVEYELHEEGFTDDIQRFDGDFDARGFEDMRWEATVYPVEIPEDVKQELIGQVNAQLFGGQDSKGALKGNAAFSSMLPMLIGQIPEMINQIGKKVRRVNLTVYYEFGDEERTLVVTQYVVDTRNSEFNLFEMGSSSDEDGLSDSGDSESK
ncbi:MAG: type IV pilus modification PilV family protein [Myxococcota bacterium]